MIPAEQKFAMLTPEVDKYRFEDFVVGPSNEEAFRRVFDIANSWPKVEVAPMLICGPRGVGKSHLLGSLLRQIRVRCSDANVAALGPDRYILELCVAMRNERLRAFQAEYNNLDIFILERVEGLAGKIHIQTDILTAFNNIIAKRGLVVVEAAILPRPVEGFTADFIDFLQSCHKLELMPPTLAERRQIVHRKYREIRRSAGPDKLADEVADLVALKCAENVRDIEHLVHTLICWSHLTQREATCDELRRLKARA